jgi:DNA-directed RNA polymerase specialized sigma24 family protein
MTNQLTDTNEGVFLANAIVERDVKTFALVYDKYAPSLLGIINKIVADTECAEEILRDTFVQIWNDIAQFDSGKSSFFTWLLNKARCKAFEQTHLHKQQFAPASPEKNNEPDHKMLLQQRKSALDMIYLAGLSYEQTASLLKMSIEDLKKIVRQEIKNL